MNTASKYFDQNIGCASKMNAGEHRDPNDENDADPIWQTPASIRWNNLKELHSVTTRSVRRLDVLDTGTDGRGMTAPLRQTDEALHEQQEWLRLTLSSIGDGVITIDNKGGVTFLNPVAQSLTGWTQEDAAGKSLDTVSRSSMKRVATRSRVLRDGVARRAREARAAHLQ